MVSLRDVLYLSVTPPYEAIGGIVEPLVERLANGVWLIGGRPMLIDWGAIEDVAPHLKDKLGYDLDKVLVAYFETEDCTLLLRA